MTNSKIAVVLMNLGGPDSLDAVEPFLFNLFSDKDIFKIPFGQRFFARVISKKRAPKVAEQYKRIGGKSPINEITEAQRIALQNALRNENIDAEVFTAMRYWRPLTEKTAREIEKENYGKIILLPLYPHYSIVTVGSALNEWRRVFRGNKNKVAEIISYYENGNYHAAVNARIDEALKKFPNESEVHLLFSAHSVPESLVKKGDPYQKQILESVESIMKSGNRANDYSVSYQSKVGPVKWLRPSTAEKIAELARNGTKNLLIIPISFVSDHIETLYELNEEARKLATENGIENFAITEGLNDSPLFIETLKKLVIEKL